MVNTILTQLTLNFIFPTKYGIPKKFKRLAKTAEWAIGITKLSQKTAPKTAPEDVGRVSVPWAVRIDLWMVKQ